MDEKKKIERTIRSFLSKHENQEVVIKAVLENIHWPSSINTDTEYFIREDDCDGERKGISISFLCDGDGIIDMKETFHIKSVSDYRTIISAPHVYRFRNMSGGGRKLLVHAALLVLAAAVAMDPDEEIKIPKIK